MGQFTWTNLNITQTQACSMTQILQFPHYKMGTVTGPTGISQRQLSYALVTSAS